MRHLLLFITVVITTAMAACTSQPKRPSFSKDHIPLQDFFKNPVASNYQISPSGEYIAYLKPYRTRMNIFVQKVGDSKSERRLTSQADRDIPNFFWKENSTLIFVRDFGGDENFHIFSVTVDGKNEKDLTPFPGVKAHVIDSLDNISDEEMIIGMNQRDQRVFDAYRLNIKSGKLDLVAENPGSYTGWLTDHDGKLRVALASDGVNTTMFYRETEQEQFREVLKTNFKDSLLPQFFTFDNKQLYVTSNLKRDRAVAAIFDPKAKKEQKIIFQHPEVDVSRLGFSKKRKVLTTASYTTWKLQRKFFDTYYEEIFRDLQAKLPGKEIFLSSVDRDEKKGIVRVWSDRSRGAFYLYNFESRELQHLAEVSPWLDENKMAEMKPLQYTSRDGLIIHGYLTLPANSDGKNLPLVVNPHGGPWHRDTWTFNPEVQFLANRGYAVLQMNFRGSTGYGKKFWSASFKKWGKEMQNDITDGVEYLVREGIADKNRICIYGGSYGGYAVLAGLAFTPDLYACGIDYVGVSNIFTLLETLPPYWEPLRAMMYEMIGHPEKDKELLKAASPVFHVDKIKAPLFVIQGAKDPRVKKTESDQIVEALRKRGVDVPYLVKENEGHGFANEENRFEAYSMMEDFLYKHLGQ